MEAKIYHDSCWIFFSNELVLKNLVDISLQYSRFNIIGFMQHNFMPFGISCIWLLSESHFAFHSFPEEGRTYIELSSCNFEKKEQFWMSLYKSFSENNIEIEVSN